MADEFEVVHHPQMNNINLFLVTIDYRSPHLHRDFEMNMVVDGQAVVSSQNETYTVSAGDILLLNPNQPHEIKTFAKPVTILCLQLSPKFFRDISPTFETVFFDAALLSDCLSKEKQNTIQKNYLKLAVQFMQKKNFYEVGCVGLLGLLMHQLLKGMPSHIASQEETRSTLKKVERLGRILEYVDHNYTHKTRLSDIAEQENLSLGYLSHFVKENLNQSFQEYVNTIRFNQARKLLLSGNKRILDVCIEAGYSDPRYLVKAFLQHTGLTPDAYRKQFEAVVETGTNCSLHSSEKYYLQQEAVEVLQNFQARVSML